MKNFMIRRSMRIDLFARGTDLNWRDKECYAWIGPLCSRGLAWEFLRRNPEYRDDFEKYVDRVKSVGFEEAKDTEEALCRKYGLSMVQGLMNPFLRTTPLFHVEDSPGLIPLRHWSYEGSPYLLRGKKGASFRLCLGPHNGPIKCMSFSEWIGEPDYPCVDVRISAVRPLEEQIKILRKKYQEARKMSGLDTVRTARRRKEVYPTYCRILDGLRSGANLNEIDNVLCADIKGYANRKAQGKRKVDEDKKAAEALMNGGYVALAAAQF